MDPECRLIHKGSGKKARLAYQGNVLVENRNDLIVDAEVLVGETARRRPSVRCVRWGACWETTRITLGADKLAVPGLDDQATATPTVDGRREYPWTRSALLGLSASVDDSPQGRLAS